ncbi:hypothetical protein RB195_012318 [Necator americanus]|uniref:Uncharacterized protein n=1 Tax=Necator americanus TaxID=51031 RepID=A0ABR1D8D9_NECAM
MEGSSKKKHAFSSPTACWGALKTLYHDFDDVEVSEGQYRKHPSKQKIQKGRTDLGLFFHKRRIVIFGLN